MGGRAGLFKSKPLRWFSNSPDKFTRCPTAMHMVRFTTGTVGGSAAGAQRKATCGHARAGAGFQGENARSWEALGEARPGQSSLSAATEAT